MNHYAEEQIQAYIQDTLTEIERTMFEEHVFSCDICLEYYMKWIDENEHYLPNMTDTDGFADEVMGRLPDQFPIVNQKKASVSERFRPFVHYAIAASITLFLMFSGVFQGMTGIASTIDETPKQESTSLTQRIMDRALLWLDFKHELPKEGEQL